MNFAVVVVDVVLKVSKVVVVCVVVVNKWAINNNVYLDKVSWIIQVSRTSHWFFVVAVVIFGVVVVFKLVEWAINNNIYLDNIC